MINIFGAFRHQQVGGMKNLGLHRRDGNEFTVTLFCLPVLRVFEVKNKKIHKFTFKRASPSGL